MRLCAVDLGVVAGEEGGAGGGAGVGESVGVVVRLCLWSGRSIRAGEDGCANLDAMVLSYVYFESIHSACAFNP